MPDDLLAVDGSLVELAALLNGRTRFCLTTHVRPDGDAVGSTLGLAALIERAGGDVYLWHTDPIGCRSGFELLGAHPWRSEPPHDLHGRMAIALDCGSLDRVAADDRLPSARPFAQLDHHISNTRFAELNVVRPEAAASCEIVAALAGLIGDGDISQAAAAPLFVGLWTDTGGYTYSNVSTATRALRDRLVGILGSREHERLVAALSAIPDSWKAYGELGRARAREIAPGVLFTDLGPAEREAVGLNREQQKLANDVALAALREQPAELHVLWYELADGTRAVSLRSPDLVPCNELAAAFEGGGHPAAAGFVTTANADQAAVDVVRALENLRSAAPA